MFSTFLRFLGCSLFSQLHRNMTKSNTNNSIHKNINVPHSASTIPSFLRPLYDRFPEAFQYFKCPHLSMVTASLSVALGYYILLVLTKTMAQGLSNLSLTQIQDISSSPPTPSSRSSSVSYRSGSIIPSVTMLLC